MNVFVISRERLILERDDSMPRTLNLRGMMTIMDLFIVVDYDTRSIEVVKSRYDFKLHGATLPLSKLKWILIKHYFMFFKRLGQADIL